MEYFLSLNDNLENIGKFIVNFYCTHLYFSKILLFNIVCKT